MNTLHIIDNPGGLPLEADNRWATSLSDGWQSGDRLLLVGFVPEAVITIRREWLPMLADGDIATILEDTQRALIEEDTALWEHALQGMLAALPDGKRRYSTHANQPSRERDFSPTASSAGEANAARPRLAFVSPMPPQATGIADYSAELLPYLAAHYEITLVTGQPDIESSLAATYSVLEPADFEASAETFDRVLYQIGNSPYHAYQFELLRHNPGTVVLHDAYLFDAVWWLKDSGAWPDGLRHQLFRDHGYPAVLALESTSQGQRGPEQYPVNGFVTDDAAGIIYHSEHARAIDRHWRPGAWRDEGAIIPHLRQLPADVTPEARRLARQALGVDETACLIASFGGINPKKLTDRLIEAVLEGDGLDQHPLHLVLVGAQHAGDFGHCIARQLKQHPRGRHITVTGYVERQDYVSWLKAADIAVQLRQQSRGESSGAILDAMAHGLAVVTNAHGSSVEIPDDCVVMLPEEVTVSDLASSLGRLVENDGVRQALGAAARDYVSTHLDPTMVATRYRDAIERFAHGARRYRREAWLDHLSQLPCVRQAGEDVLAAHARRLVETGDMSPDTPPRILFDVSTIAWHDLKTGIERVTRRIADRLLRQPPPGWRVELVRWGGDDFHLARGFASDQLGIRPPGPDRPCQARPGDIYVSVEWAPPLLEQAGEALRRMRAMGVRCYFTVHDLLPLHMPQCFPEGTPETMRRWFDDIASLADGITCVSATVAEDVRRELATPTSAHRPWVEAFHLGADFSSAQHDDVPLERSEQAMLSAVEALDGPTLLMVGTMEPRKGHRQVLEALERCWQDGHAINLVIVGKQGWQVDDLASRLARHALRDRRLFWVEGASDGLLLSLYESSDALLAASFGEGFGLPLIEAAHRGIPILARDIPVFREVAGDHADYFQADSPEALARALTQWRERWSRGELRDSAALPFNNWAQSTDQWLTPILADLPVSNAPGQPGEVSA
ncbi:glycosyltransferase [Halomonas organivorans]|uniref:Glycosyltransferase involved in cell wall biosynthesis n=1 Tax=Halomonas organivorans TaxID=257772 RepID=A0A7W5C0Z7_9GAMM|nr:glycosyltransferase [Halomonas organivorans]MBB3142870.1 glycosyltransferase involved in cell wall biosynthesis [Halomonas organivorans]